MAEDDDTMTTDDTEVVAQAPADADAIAIPLVLVPGGNPDPLLNLNDFRAVVADLSYTILSSLLCLATSGQFSTTSLLSTGWKHALL